MVVAGGAGSGNGWKGCATSGPTSSRMPLPATQTYVRSGMPGHRQCHHACPDRLSARHGRFGGRFLQSGLAAAVGQRVEFGEGVEILRARWPRSPSHPLSGRREGTSGCSPRRYTYTWERYVKHQKRNEGTRLRGRRRRRGERRCPDRASGRPPRHLPTRCYACRIVNSPTPVLREEVVDKPGTPRTRQGCVPPTEDGAHCPPCGLLVRNAAG